MPTIINSLDITRISQNYWELNYNELPDPLGADNYSGYLKPNGFIDFTTKRGAGIISAHYSVISYVDNVEPENNFSGASSGTIVMRSLKAVGFFGNDVSGGGGTGVDTFKELLDVDVPSFTGRDGQILFVNGDFIDTKQDPSQNLRLQDLSNYIEAAVGFGSFPPGKLLMTSTIIGSNGNARGFLTVSPINYINRAPSFDEISILKKGYQFVDGILVPNEEMYAEERGDWLLYTNVTEANEVYLCIGRWKGNTLEASDMAEAVSWFVPLEDEPGFG